MSGCSTQIDEKREGDETVNDGWMRKRRRRAVCVCVSPAAAASGIQEGGREGGMGEKKSHQTAALSAGCGSGCWAATHTKHAIRQRQRQKRGVAKEPCYLPAARKKNARVKNVKGEIAKITEKEGKKDAEGKREKEASGLNRQFRFRRAEE